MPGKSKLKARRDKHREIKNRKMTDVSPSALRFWVVN